MLESNIYLSITFYSVLWLINTYFFYKKCEFSAVVRLFWALAQYPVFLVLTIFVVYVIININNYLETEFQNIKLAFSIYLILSVTIALIVALIYLLINYFLIKKIENDSSYKPWPSTVLDLLLYEIDVLTYSNETVKDIKITRYVSVWSARYFESAVFMLIFISISSGVYLYLLIQY